jgi:hypothetical protein
MALYPEYSIPHNRRSLKLEFNIGSLHLYTSYCQYTWKWHVCSEKIDTRHGPEDEYTHNKINYVVKTTFHNYVTEF